eukprot:GHVR01126154.1.p3 GENE.GHVR01126154.1~~GHVR01126154.1.p3  ORF type:complete len:178 (-),score=31.55 GHVR01126154.1:163-696(-)
MGWTTGTLCPMSEACVVSNKRAWLQAALVELVMRSDSLKFEVLDECPGPRTVGGDEDVLADICQGSAAIAEGAIDALDSACSGALDLAGERRVRRRTDAEGSVAEIAGVLALCCAFHARHDEVLETRRFASPLVRVARVADSLQSGECLLDDRAGDGRGVTPCAEAHMGVRPRSFVV